MRVVWSVTVAKPLANSNFAVATSAPLGPFNTVVKVSDAAVGAP
jgi:hypothetical protein